MGHFSAAIIKAYWIASPQIDFLNSVIVDMQRKNDDLKAKMELYEAAGIVDTADAADMAEYMFNGVNRAQAAVAPR